MSAIKSPSIFKSAVKNLGVHVSTTWMDDQECLFVHFEDTTKAQEKQIAQLAIRYGMKIDISDKGAIFS
jgi:hypothetical protein